MPTVSRQDIESLLVEFSGSVTRQNECIEQGDWQAGNEFANRYVVASKGLHDIGDDGIEAFCTLLNHSDIGVRSMAAAFLLASRTEQAEQESLPV